MPARYHPLFDGIWNEEKFRGAPFEEIGFFVYLFGNARQRPSGIYRVTDPQICADTRLPLGKVRRYVGDLETRSAIVRDEEWIFIVGYLGRQSKNGNLLNGVATDIAHCTSKRILEAFGEKYSRLRQWSAERLASIGQPSGNLGIHKQNRTEQNRTEQTTDGGPLANRVLDEFAKIAARAQGKTVAEVREDLRREDGDS